MPGAWSQWLCLDRYLIMLWLGHLVRVAQGQQNQLPGAVCGSSSMRLCLRDAELLVPGGLTTLEIDKGVFGRHRGWFGWFT